MLLIAVIGEKHLGFFVLFCGKDPACDTVGDYFQCELSVVTVIAVYLFGLMCHILSAYSFMLRSEEK